MPTGKDLTLGVSTFYKMQSNLNHSNKPLRWVEFNKNPVSVSTWLDKQKNVVS